MKVVHKTVAGSIIDVTTLARIKTARRRAKKLGMSLFKLRGFPFDNYMLVDNDTNTVLYNGGNGIASLEDIEDALADATRFRSYGAA